MHPTAKRFEKVGTINRVGFRSPSPAMGEARGEGDHLPPLRKAKGDASAASRGMPEIHPVTPARALPRTPARARGTQKKQTTPSFPRTASSPRRGDPEKAKHAAHNRRNASFQTATVTRIAAIPAITNANGAPHS